MAVLGFYLETEEAQGFEAAYTCHPRTYSIKKARKRLRYEPVDDRDEQAERRVEWALRMQRKAA